MKRVMLSSSLSRSLTELETLVTSLGFSVLMMIVQPGGKVGFCWTLKSADLNVTPPNTGETVKVRPLGKLQVVYRMTRCVRKKIAWDRRLRFTSYPFGFGPSLAGIDRDKAGKDSPILRTELVM